MKALILDKNDWSIEENLGRVFVQEDFAVFENYIKYMGGGAGNASGHIGYCSAYCDSNGCGTYSGSNGFARDIIPTNGAGLAVTNGVMWDIE